MDNTRVVVIDGRECLQTPLIRLRNSNGDEAMLALNVHVGRGKYFEQIRRAIMHFGGIVFYEGVRNSDALQTKETEPLAQLLQMVYERLVPYMRLAFLKDNLPFGTKGWMNADVDASEIVAEFRSREVSLGKLRVACWLLRLLLWALFGAGDPTKADAVRLRDKLYSLGNKNKLGLVAGRFKTFRALQEVIVDFRNQRAIETVFSHMPSRFVLIYGAGHGEGLLTLLAERGYEEVSREWLTVISRPCK